MFTVSATIRKRIVAQGFCDIDDEMMAQVNYPLRLAPALCLAWTAVGAALESPGILFTLVPFAFLGAILPGHPFDVIYNFGLRYLMDKPALPRYGPRRRFACAMAGTMLIVSALGFQCGIPLLGNIMGWSLVAAAFVNVSTGVCVPSFILRIFLGEVVCRRPE